MDDELELYGSVRKAEDEATVAVVLVERRQNREPDGVVVEGPGTTEVAGGTRNADLHGRSQAAVFAGTPCRAVTRT